MALFHNHGTPGYYLHLIEKALAEKKITKTEGDTITKFIQDAQATSGINGLRSTKLTQTLTSWKQFLKQEYGKAKRDDIYGAVSLLNQSQYKRNTKNDHIRILKQFYSWMIRRNLTKISKDDMSDIKGPGVDTENTEARDLLSRDEITSIIGACKNLRDRAIIAVLFESAARISELSRIRWGNLDYTDSGIINLTIHDEKTKKKRYAPLLMSVEYLAAWRSAYPGNPTNDALIFIDTINGGSMEYRSISQQVTRAASRAGIEKRCNPHIFRKSRLTEMVREGYQESVIKEVGWANQSSQMLKTYIKLGKEDVLNEFMEKSGIKKKSEKTRNNLPRQCSYCFAMNSPISEYCHKCGKPLSEEAKKSQADVIAAIDKKKYTPAEIARAIEVLESLKKGV